MQINYDNQKIKLNSSVKVYTTETTNGRKNNIVYKLEKSNWILFYTRRVESFVTCNLRESKHVILPPPQCFVTWCLEFISGRGSLYCDVLHCINIKHRIFLVPDINAIQYAAVRAAVLQTSDIQNNTNLSKYKICKWRIYWRVVAYRVYKNYGRI